MVNVRLSAIRCSLQLQWIASDGTSVSGRQSQPGVQTFPLAEATSSGASQVGLTSEQWGSWACGCQASWISTGYGETFTCLRRYQRAPCVGGDRSATHRLLAGRAEMVEQDGVPCAGHHERQVPGQAPRARLGETPWTVTHLVKVDPLPFECLVKVREAVDAQQFRIEQSVRVPGEQHLINPGRGQYDGLTEILQFQ